MQHRATFTSAYAVPRDSRYQMNYGHRLGDCMIEIAPYGSPLFDRTAEGAEFAVIDIKTREKAWFEKPDGYSLEKIGAMIEAHFGVSALRADVGLWFV